MDFLEECKARLTEAQKHFQLTQQELMAAQNRHQLAAQEMNSLQILINAETARRQKIISATVPMVSADTAKIAVSSTAEIVPIQTSEINKTDVVREILGQHPTGITPTEIWKEVKDLMSHRAYLYSILGRLKDRNEVIVRRKKYFLKVVPKSGEEKDHATVN